MITVLAAVGIVTHYAQGLIKRVLRKKQPHPIPWNGWVDSEEFYNTY